MLPIKFLTAVVFMLTLGACAMGRDEMTSDGKQAYINAHLGFAISYPESWASFLVENGSDPYTDYTVEWSIEPEDSPGSAVSLLVISIPRDEIFPPDDMTAILTDRHPNLTVTDRGATSLPAGEALQLQGYTPQKRFLAWTLDGRRRSFLVVCSAPPGIYAEYAPLFGEIIQSFEILE